MAAYLRQKTSSSMWLAAIARIRRFEQLVVRDVLAVAGSNELAIALVVFGALGPILAGQAHQRRV